MRSAPMKPPRSDIRTAWNAARRYALAFAAVLPALWWSPEACGDGLEIKARTGVGYFENIEQKPTGGQNDTGLGAGLSVDYLEHAPRVDMDIRGTGTVISYVDGTYGQQFQGAFVGFSKFSLVPEYLDWSINDTYGRVLEDPLSNDNPENIAYDNYLSTGPDMYFNLGSLNRVSTHLRYGRSDYQSQAVPSNHFYSGEFVFAHQLSRFSEISLHVDHRRIEYEGNSPGVTAIGGYFELGDAFMRLEMSGAHGRLSLDLGVTRYRDDQNSPTAPLAILSWDRKLSRLFSVSASAGTRYAETLDRLQRLETQSPLSGSTRQDVVAQAGPMQERFADLLIQATGERTVVALRGRYSRVQYDTSSELAKQHFSDITAELSRRLNHNFDFVASAVISEREFANLSRRDRDRIINADLRWNLTSRLNLNFGYAHIQRNSTDADLQSFRANTYTVMLIYTPVERVYGQHRSNTQRAAGSF